MSGRRDARPRVRARTFIPNRGDAIWIDFDPQAGHEQAGRRPALVLSPESYNGLVGLALVCPITNKRKGYPFEVVIPDGVNVTGTILADQVRSLDWKIRRAEFIARLPDSVVREALAKARTLLDP